jgi:hypothetical protein
MNHAREKAETLISVNQIRGYIWLIKTKAVPLHSMKLIGAEKV